MLDFNIEKFKRLPMQPGIWQGGVFRMPAWVTGERDKPHRPLIALWVDPNEPRISQACPVEDKDPERVAFDSLITFALDGGRKSYRPSAVEVNNPAVATILEERLRGAGVRIDRVTDLPVMRRVLEELSEHMNKRKEPPGALTGTGVKIEHVRAFAESAARFFRARLWEELSDDDLIEILDPSPPPSMRMVSVLGHGGQTFGLGFFESLKEFEKMCTAASPGRFFAKHGTWSMTFGDITELPFADADLWEDHQLAVADAEAYPCALWFGPKRQIRRPNSHELTFLEGLLRALAESTGEEMDAGQWSHSVKANGRNVEYRFSLVHEVDEPAAEASDLRGNPQHRRRAMEQGMANLQRLMEEHEFGSIDEVSAFIRANVNKDDPMEAAPRSPLERAQELLYEAWDCSGRRSRKLARRALEISPDCADAYVLLAEDTSDLAKACELYQKGVEAGERAIAQDVFKEEVGHFWGILETRPYMRARAGLAQVLWQLGQKAEAVSHYEELLRLNPGDNQGIRYLLAACLLELGDDEKLGRLLDANADDGTAQWCYLRALGCYRREGDTAKARKLAKAALKSNRHVPDLLCGKRRLPEQIPSSFHLGQEDEAVCCASEILSGWRATAGALDWLANMQQERRGRSNEKRWIKDV